MSTDRDEIIKIVRSIGGGIAKGVLDANLSICLAYNIGSLAIPSGTWTALTFSNDSYDPFDWHGTATNTQRINISTSALWLATIYNANFNTNSAGHRGIRMYDSDGVEIGTHYFPAVTGTYTSIPFLGWRYGGGSGKYIYAEVFQSSGGTLAFNAMAKIAVVKFNPHSTFIT